MARTRSGSASLLFLLALAGPALGQPPQVSASFGQSGRVTADESVTLVLSRPLTPEEGRLAVFLGTTDWTGLWTSGPATLSFVPGKLALPVGANSLTLHRVTGTGEWHELARFALQVDPPRVVPRALVKPTLDVGMKAQFAERHEPADNAPPRESFADLTAQLALTTERTRGSWAAKTGLKLVGTSYRNEALRFSTLGVQAPRLDLAGYTLELRQGRLGLQVGDLKLGRHRHLLQDFGSRGVSLTLGLGPRAVLTLGGVAGSKLVGWDNPLGLDTAEHRLLAATLGLALLPEEQGQLRLEATLQDGSLLPLASYNQGLVNDAEESTGLGLRLLAADKKKRVRLDAGYARSRFQNPEDPLLAQGSALVAVTETESEARYADLHLDLLQAVDLGGRDLTLGASLLHERVDPLYRSVGARLASDRLSNTGGLGLQYGEVALRYTHGRSHDNLERVPSVLETRTRRDQLDLSLPFGVLRSPTAEPSAWLPLLTYQWNRVRQFGAGVPLNSGFNETHVPDQVNTIHTGSLAFEGAKAALTYDLSLSRQDNRQVGRETADFDSLVQTVTLSLTPHPSLDASLDAALERNESRQSQEVQRLRRLGLQLAWRLPRGFGLTALVSHTTDETAALGTDANTFEGDVQATWRFQFARARKQPSATLFLRGGRQRARLIDLLAQQRELRSAWQLATGVTLSAF